MMTIREHLEKVADYIECLIEENAALQRAIDDIASKGGEAIAEKQAEIDSLRRANQCVQEANQAFAQENAELRDTCGILRDKETIQRLERGVEYQKSLVRRGLVLRNKQERRIERAIAALRGQGDDQEA